MDKHLTEIEVFEYANQLITDEQLLHSLQNHVSACSDCKVKVETEKLFSLKMKKSMQVKKQVDLSEKIANYFAQDTPNFIGLDTKGVIYVILFLSVLMMLSQVIEIEIKTIQISYLNVIFSSIVGLLFIELVWKYRKYKKNHPTV